MAKNPRFLTTYDILNALLQGAKTPDDLCAILNEMRNQGMDIQRYLYKTIYRKFKENIISKRDFEIIKCNTENRFPFFTSDNSAKQIQDKLKLRLEKERKKHEEYVHNKKMKVQDKNFYTCNNVNRPYRGGKASGK